MQVWKRPRVQMSEVHKEIYKRTGIPAEIAHRVLDTYAAIIKECLKSEVEVALMDIGVLTWKTSPPQAERSVYNFHTKQRETRKGLDGYNRTTVRFGRVWQQELRDATRIKYGTEETGD